MTGSILPRGSQQLAHHIPLVVAGEDPFVRFTPGFGVFLLDKLGVVFDNVHQVIALEDILPQIACLDAAGIGRVTSTIVIALV